MMEFAAGEGSTFARFLTPLGILEFVSFPNGGKYMREPGPAVVFSAKTAA
jgi:hypothetical protein